MSARVDRRTDLLLSAPIGRVGADARARIRGRLVDGVTGAVADLPAGGVVDVGLASLRRSRSHPELVGVCEPPFTWKPAFVRRSLGLAAVRACAEGRFRGPASAVGPLAEQAVEEWRRTGWRTFHWEPWFAGLAGGGRAVVLAEAISWSTPVWAAFDWAAVGPRSVVGGPDDLWTCPAPRAVRLKGRCEARVRLDPIDGGPARPGSCEGASCGGVTALVSVCGGRPGDGWREELAYLALVAGLHTADRPVPVRVLGMWPEAAVYQAVEIDEDLLARAVDRVVGTVAATVAAT
ncbi:MAG: hypothetical protein ABSB09_04840 [Acidimicrobiales bacterium]